MIASKPLQKVSWTKKVRNHHQWFKDTADYYIASSSFGDAAGGSNRIQNLKTLYEIYNSVYPTSWFKHVTDPFSTGRVNGSNMLAKIRPMNILRPNIEFLRGTYPKRVFNWSVNVKGEDGYNALLEGKKQAAYQSMSQLFINTLNQASEQEIEQGGAGFDTGIESKETEMPDTAVSKFVGSFKNILAVQAQADMELIMADQDIEGKLTDMLKDWLIVGEAYSWKDVINDEVIYERVDPTEIDYDKSPDVKFINQASWVVRRKLLEVADVVDRFYLSLKSKDIDKLEDGSYLQSAGHFNNYLNGKTTAGNKVAVFHVTWRAYEKVGMLSFPNPITGKIEEDIVNEEYKATPELGETIQWIWRSRWMEEYRIGDDLHVEMGPVRFAPSMMNNLGKTTGPYNGKRFSDLHSDNISILKLGLPFQIMYVIANFAMERTLAKSRGKIVLIDKAVIPNGPGWNEERFFSFSEAQGWGLIDRSQIGVDKSYNQYQVLDLGLFDHINNLIEIMDFSKRQYDEQLGISRQAKAQVNTGDTASGTQTAVYQSSIITEMIYSDFDDLRGEDLKDLLDCSQIANVRGKRAAYVSGEGRQSLLNIIPEEYCYSQMGLIIEDNKKANDVLTKMKNNSQAFAQNGATPSTVIAMEMAGNVSKLQELLLNVEKKQQEVEQAAAQSEQEAQMAQIELQQQFGEYNALLETQKMHEEYNRKEDLVLIQGDINMALQAAVEQPGDDGTAATEALMKFSNESAKIAAENDRKNKEISLKAKAQVDKQKAANSMDAHKKKLAEKDHALKREIGNKKLAIDKMKAKQRPKAK